MTMLAHNVFEKYEGRTMAVQKTKEKFVKDGYVNVTDVAIGRKYNTWYIAQKSAPVELAACPVKELAEDIGVPYEEIDYLVAGINHMAFYLNFEARQADGTYRDLYPALRAGYAAGRIPKPSHWNARCPNKVRYEVMTHFGHFVTESSEHFAEYVPWFIKTHRPDLIETFGIPLDEYPIRCEEQIAAWAAQAKAYEQAETITVKPSNEYAATIMNSVVTGAPSVIYGNVPNRGFIPQLPAGAAVEVPTLVDANGLQPTTVNDIPPHLIALMRTNINVQELTVQALLDENRDHIYHAAMLDPHTAAELDLRQIRALVDDLIVAHGDWLPGWITGKKAA